ncbi:MAG: hypothetical protein R2834_21640 [Rhodothermales bacterium]
MDIGSYISLLSWVSGFVFAGLSLIYTVRHFKLVRTLTYIERMNSPEMGKVRANVDQWLSSSKNDVKKLEKLYKDDKLMSDLRLFTNLFTELGVAYKFRLVNKKLTHELWYPMIMKYWNGLEFYIYDKRKKGVYIGYYFEMMSNEILNYVNNNKKLMADRYSSKKGY